MSPDDTTGVWIMKRRQLLPLVTGAAVVTLLIGIFVFSYIYWQDLPLRGMTPMPFAVAPAQMRLLVFAPHCDDEALGAAALIRDVTAGGGQVMVVIMTNGDGFTFATEEEFRRLYVSSADYIRTGYNRQQESLHALSLLGVDSRQVLFLGYPDRGLAHMWQSHWSVTQPYRSPYTATDHSPYRNSYQPHVLYAGENVLANVKDIIAAFSPTAIVLPNAFDEHPDHWGTGAFVRTAVAQLTVQGQLPQEPVLYTYLVHRGDYPVPHGLVPDAPLLPPAPLAATGLPWYSYRLDDAAQQIKARAIDQYTSQIRLPVMSSLLRSFIRTNELFAPAISATAGTASPGADLMSPATWRDVPPLLVNSLKEKPLTALEGAGNVKAVYGLVQDGVLWLRIETRRPATASVRYRVDLIAFHPTSAGFARTMVTADSARPKAVPEASFTLDQDVVYRIPLSTLANPAFLFLRVTTSLPLGLVVDRTPYQLVYVPTLYHTANTFP